MKALVQFTNYRHFAVKFLESGIDFSEDFSMKNHEPLRMDDLNLYLRWQYWHWFLIAVMILNS